MFNRFNLTFSTITRPANTTQYASGDLIANSETAASVVAMSVQKDRLKDEPFEILRATLHKDDDDLTAATFRLHVFTADPVGTAPTAGDNGAIALNGLSAGQYLGHFDFDMTTGTADPLADGNQKSAAPAAGTNMLVLLSGADTLYGILEAQGTYTPASGEVFTVTLECEQ